MTTLKEGWKILVVSHESHRIPGNSAGERAGFWRVNFCDPFKGWNRDP